MKLDMKDFEWLVDSYTIEEGKQIVNQILKDSGVKEIHFCPGDKACPLCTTQQGGNLNEM